VKIVDLNSSRARLKPNHFHGTLSKKELLFLEQDSPTGYKTAIKG